jgi:cyclopropane-fatty-acyl-phospholipid synthase
MAVADDRTTTRPLAANPRPWDRVAICYAAVDTFFPICGLFDLTEGIYGGNPDTPHELAQSRQHDYLLDQVRCGPGRRVLDLGCGYGTLLERIRQRGGRGLGITVAPQQLRHCRRKQLGVHLLDYRAVPAAWHRRFDGVIANGSIEHLVRPADVAAGKADDVYRHLFATVHRLIDPDAQGQRFVTATIHFAGQPPDPRDLSRWPFAFRWGSDNFHWAVLELGWGGYYPRLGQLERCARGYFDLLEEIDGTEDYRWTSEAWRRRVRGALRSRRLPQLVLRSVPLLARFPSQSLALLLGFLVSESWNWQFRPPRPPARLLRQTWGYRAGGS